MADQYAIIDQNRKPAELIHSGTSNDAETIRRTGQASGAGDVHVTGGTAFTDDLLYELRIDDPDNGTVYFGESTIPGTASAAMWRIFRFTDNDGTCVLRWADGNRNFDNVWDNRGTLSYGTA